MTACWMCSPAPGGRRPGRRAIQSERAAEMGHRDVSSERPARRSTPTRSRSLVQPRDHGCACLQDAHTGLRVRLLRPLFSPAGGLPLEPQCGNSVWGGVCRRSDHQARHQGEHLLERAGCIAAQSSSCEHAKLLYRLLPPRVLFTNRPTLAPASAAFGRMQHRLPRHPGRGVPNHN